MGSSAHGLNLSRPASSSQRRAHGVNLYTGSRSHSSGVIGSPTGRPTARPSYQRTRCNSNNLSPSLGSQQVQALYPARGCRGPGQRQARLPGSSSSPSCPLDAGQPLIAGEVSKAGLARPKASLCCSPPGMKMGSDSPGQLMPFPYKPRSGRVINGDEPELSSGREIRRRGCNRLHHHGATWQMITGHTKKGKVSGASACACIRGGFGTFAWTSVGR